MNRVRQKTRECPLCQNVSGRIIADIRAEQVVLSSPYYDESVYDRLGISPNAIYSLSQCRKCALVYTSSVPSPTFLERLYGGDGSVEDSAAVFARPARAAFAFRSLSRLLQAIATRIDVDGKGVAPRPIRILDVGCAYGVGSLGLTRTHYPYQVSGVEVSPGLREYLSSQGMITYASLDDVPSGTFFDGIILNDVLEHVPDPVSFVAKLQSLSAGHTAIWVNVPNFIDWRLTEIVKQIKAGHSAIPMDVNPWEHLSYFSPQSLDALMAKIGAGRMAVTPIEYPIACESLTALLKAWARLARDTWRIYLRSYPQRFETSAIFVFDK